MPPRSRDSADSDAPDPICTRCSKPIAPGTTAQWAGHLVHLKCLAQSTQLESVEQQDRFSRARERAVTLTARASELVAQARNLPRLCSVCARLLSEGTLLFQGDQLVHAACWRADAERFDDPSPAAHAAVSAP